MDGYTYAAYGRHHAIGYRVASTVDVARTKFAGEPTDGDLPWYWLGERLFSPVLARFLQPDRYSPFDKGGLNRYAYCGGDPINRSDPTGQAWWNWLLVGLSIIAGAIITVASGGALAGAMAAAVAGSATAAMTTGTMVTLAATTVLSAASVVVEVASVVAAATGDTKTSQILGFVGLGLGIASSALGALPALANGASRFVANGVKTGLASKLATVGNGALKTPVLGMMEGMKSFSNTFKGTSGAMAQAMKSGIMKYRPIRYAVNGSSYFIFAGELIGGALMRPPMPDAGPSFDAGPPLDTDWVRDMLWEVRLRAVAAEAYSKQRAMQQLALRQAMAKRSAEEQGLVWTDSPYASSFGSHRGGWSAGESGGPTNVNLYDTTIADELAFYGPIDSMTLAALNIYAGRGI